MDNCCPPVQSGRGKWFSQPALWAICLVAAILALGSFWPAAAPVSCALWGYLAKSGWALALGLVLGGCIERYVPKEYITVWLTGRHRRTVVASAGLGFLASSCSHGCLALSMEIYRKGASVPAVITFLLASPWASLSLTLLIVSLMGWKGLLIVIVALVIAACTGFIFQRLEAKGLLESNPNTITVKSGFSIRTDLRERFRRKSWDLKTAWADLRAIARGAWSLAQMVLLWVAIGFSLSAILGTTIPATWWGRFLGPTPLGLLVTLGLATAIEVCSEGTAPMAVELFRRTGALGNAFTFLMAGVVTDVTELSVVWANLGKKTVGWLLLATLPQVFLWGMVMNHLGR